MACIDKSGAFEELLLKYAEHAVDPVNRGKLALHLRDCAHCRDRLKDISLFLNIISMADTDRALGDKGECPPTDELVLLSESPGSIAPERVEEIKKHLLECMRCRDQLRGLVGLNKQLKKPEYIEKHHVPAAVERKIKRVVAGLVNSGAATGEPVVISLENAAGAVDAETCRAVTGRELPAGQETIQLVAGEIAGTITDSSGKPVGAERVTLRRGGKNIYVIRTNHAGGFVFRNLSQGFYEVRARASGVLVILVKGKGHGRQH